MWTYGLSLAVAIRFKTCDVCEFADEGVQRELPDGQKAGAGALRLSSEDELRHARHPLSAVYPRLVVATQHGYCHSYWSDSARDCINLHLRLN